MKTLGEWIREEIRKSEAGNRDRLTVYRKGRLDGTIISLYRVFHEICAREDAEREADETFGPTHKGIKIPIIGTLGDDGKVTPIKPKPQFRDHAEEIHHALKERE